MKDDKTIERGQKKLDKLVRKKMDEWAADYSVRHRSTSKGELQQNFIANGYKFGEVQDGQRIRIWLERTADKKELNSGEVYLDFNMRGETAIYEKG
ncbi:hypothetical protein [Paenibacillus crassostreae]|uniref:Uncharacterized protein n=1 Tax=Paenibacillus crassostreae TaxID=1763538 RepID=A0A162KNT2_9BACL|nr:hypothetical protein [Paenibacillus crassostreae]AOZ93636.1 hypothetical protein LPB68_16505 [Paenibacillus crassostreae]OAB71463.1 hypothetical protein PNBC_19375 [Paenibacillus crassostreae]